MARYRIFENGKELRVDWVNQKIGCCDCGLVHKVSQRVVNGLLFMTMEIDKRATAACRRETRKRLGVEDASRYKNGKKEKAQPQQVFAIKRTQRKGGKKIQQAKEKARVATKA